MPLPLCQSALKSPQGLCHVAKMALTRQCLDSKGVLWCLAPSLTLCPAHSTNGRLSNLEAKSTP